MQRVRKEIAKSYEHERGRKKDSCNFVPQACAAKGASVEELSAAPRGFFGNRPLICRVGQRCFAFFRGNLGFEMFDAPGESGVGGGFGVPGERGPEVEGVVVYGSCGCLDDYYRRRYSN
jgi:hypothetical protein